MADANEAHRRDSTSEAKSSPDLPESVASPSEIIDAEVVDSSTHREPTPPPGPPPGSGAQAEQFRQFQQFLEFQKFQEWQRGQGSQGTGFGAGDQRKAPWWKRILRLLQYKFVRRLLYVVVILLLIYYLVNSLISSLLGSSGGSSQNGTGGSAPPNSAPITSTSPELAIMGVYNYLRGDQPERACELFQPGGKSAFALAYGAPDCATAARTIHSQISEPGPYANPKFGEDAVEPDPPVGNEVAVYGCRMQVTGGPPLGTFKLVKAADGGWVIAAYAPHSDKCP